MRPIHRSFAFNTSFVFIQLQALPNATHKDFHGLPNPNLSFLTAIRWLSHSYFWFVVHVILISKFNALNISIINKDLDMMNYASFECFQDGSAKLSWRLSERSRDTMGLETIRAFEGYDGRKL